MWAGPWAWARSGRDARIRFPPPPHGGPPANPAPAPCQPPAPLAMVLTNSPPPPRQATSPALGRTGGVEGGGRHSVSGRCFFQFWGYFKAF